MSKRAYFERGVITSPMESGSFGDVPRFEGGEWLPRATWVGAVEVSQDVNLSLPAATWVEVPALAVTFVSVGPQAVYLDSGIVHVYLSSAADFRAVSSVWSGSTEVGGGLVGAGSGRSDYLISWRRYFSGLQRKTYALKFFVWSSLAVTLTIQGTTHNQHWVERVR